MDPIEDERGQAALFVVALLAIGALTVTGLLEAQARIVAASVERAAAEAAVEAATSVFADAYASELRARAADPSRAPRDMSAVLSEPDAVRRAHAAGDEMAMRNGGAPLDDLRVTCERGIVDVSASMRGTRVRAGVAGAACSKR